MGVANIYIGYNLCERTRTLVLRRVTLDIVCVRTSFGVANSYIGHNLCENMVWSGEQLYRT